MDFVDCWSEDELVVGKYSGGIYAPAPTYVESAIQCPMCFTPLSRVSNAEACDIHRVAQFSGEKNADGRYEFVAQRLNTRTHTLYGCLSCKVGFTVPKRGEASGSRASTD